MFFETNTSINEDNIKANNIISEINVCLKILSFIVSLSLSCITELCNFIPLTANIIMHGINKVFCSNMLEAITKKPFPHTYSLYY